VPRGGLHAVDAVAQLDDVDVELQDPLFAQEQFHPKGVISLQALANPRAPLPQKQRTSALLTDRGRPTRATARGTGFQDGESDVLKVKSSMFEKALILSSQY